MGIVIVLTEAFVLSLVSSDIKTAVSFGTCAPIIMETSGYYSRIWVLAGNILLLERSYDTHYTTSNSHIVSSDNYWLHLRISRYKFYFVSLKVEMF